MTLEVLTVGALAFASTKVAHPAAGPTLQRYGHRILPWVLIAIGVHVLSDFRLTA